MIVVPYREILDYEGLFELLWSTFPSFITLNPKSFKKWINLDPRLRKGPIGFCALEEEKIVGFVGVMDILSRTLSEETETVGGIWGVSTFPGQDRKGIATSLSEEAHKYFNSRNYRFSFLTTDRTTVAYAFYKKLGYEDATEFPFAYRFTKSTLMRRNKEELSSFDWKKIAKIYDTFSQDRTGFVVRDECYFKELRKCGRITTENVVSLDNGYVIFKKEGSLLRIKENIAVETKSSKRIIQQKINRIPVSFIHDGLVLDHKILRVYESMGFNTKVNSYATLMVKPLTADTIFEEQYGQNFYMSSYDNIVVP